MIFVQEISSYLVVNYDRELINLKLSFLNDYLANSN